MDGWMDGWVKRWVDDLMVGWRTIVHGIEEIFVCLP